MQHLLIPHAPMCTTNRPRVYAGNGNHAAARHANHLMTDGLVIAPRLVVPELVQSDDMFSPARGGTAHKLRVQRPVRGIRRTDGLGQQTGEAVIG